MQNAGQNVSEETQSLVNHPQWEGFRVPQEPAGLDSQGTGGGTIGTGNVPTPGEDEFAG